MKTNASTRLSASPPSGSSAGSGMPPAFTHASQALCRGLRASCGLELRYSAARPTVFCGEHRREVGMTLSYRISSGSDERGSTYAVHNMAPNFKAPFSMYRCYFKIEEKNFMYTRIDIYLY